MSRTDPIEGLERLSEGTTRERLLRAAEIVFARDGIHAARVRDINKLARQRNPSALHYHFGSRLGLVEAIMLRHQDVIDAEYAEKLDALEARGDFSLRDVVEVAVRPIAARLETPSGRDFLRIIPQLAHALGASLRKGAPSPVTAQSRRILRLLDERLSHLPEEVRRERLVVFVLMIGNIAANRAQLIAAGRTPALGTPRFVQHFIDVIDSALRAPDTTARAATD